jgi:RNA polymerase sigma-70 factor (sigma-E family)
VRVQRRVDAVDPRLGDYVRGQWPALVRYATALCGDASQAEELVQSALVRVALRWPFLRDKDDPGAYVRKAVVNAQRNRWRRLGRRELTVAEPPERPAADRTSAVDDHVLVRQVLATLPPRQRAVLALRFLEDQSAQQTAALLGCSVGTVKSQTSKGLAKLRAALGEGEGEVR